MPDISEYRKPLPGRRGYAREFYEYCRKHELRFRILARHSFKQVGIVRRAIAGIDDDQARRVHSTIAVNARLTI